MEGWGHKVQEFILWQETHLGNDVGKFQRGACIQKAGSGNMI